MDVTRDKTRLHMCVLPYFIKWLDVGVANCVLCALQVTLWRTRLEANNCAGFCTCSITNGRI
jgi:hypothetical protein